MEYKISEDLAKSVISYLAKQPYIQVFELVSAMQNLEKIDSVTPVEEKTT